MFAKTSSSYHFERDLCISQNGAYLHFPCRAAEGDSCSIFGWHCCCVFVLQQTQRCEYASSSYQSKKLSSFYLYLEILHYFYMHTHIHDEVRTRMSTWMRVCCCLRSCLRVFNYVFGVSPKKKKKNVFGHCIIICL